MWQPCVGGTEYRRSLVHLKPRKEPIALPDRYPSSCGRNPENPNLLSAENRPTPAIVNKHSNTERELSPTAEADQFPLLPSQAPTAMTESQINPAAVSPESSKTKSKRVRPVTPLHLNRPKREMHIPVKFKDYTMY